MSCCNHCAKRGHICHMFQIHKLPVQEKGELVPQKPLQVRSCPEGVSRASRFPCSTHGWLWAPTPKLGECLEVTALLSAGRGTEVRGTSHTARELRCRDSKRSRRAGHAEEGDAGDKAALTQQREFPSPGKASPVQHECAGHVRAREQGGDGSTSGNNSREAVSSLECSVVW